MTSTCLPPHLGDNSYELSGHKGTFTASDISGTFVIFLLVFGASELIVFLVCRWIGQYTNAAFYSDGLDWIHYEDNFENEDSRSPELLSKSLEMNKFVPTDKTENCCPICLANFGKLVKLKV